jgi:hypothetical protein
MFRRQQPLDERQNAEFARLLKENGWLIRQSMPKRFGIWCLFTAIWPGAVLVPIAALAGWNWWLTWLATVSVFGPLFSVPVFWPERAARLGATQLMSRAEEQRLRDLPPRHPGRNL